MTARRLLVGALVVALAGALTAWLWRPRTSKSGPAVPTAGGREAPPPERLADLAAARPADPPQAAPAEVEAPPESATREQVDSSSAQSSQFRTGCRAAKAHFDWCQEKQLADLAVAALHVVTLSILPELDRAGRLAPQPEKFATRLGDPVDGVFRIPVGERVHSFRVDEFTEYETLKALIETRTEQRAAVVPRLQPGESPPAPLYEPLPAERVAAVEEYAARAAP